MIERLLIANRGEIVVRIARTAHRLGIDTVGVYSEPDLDAVHTEAVDLAVALGGTGAAESYLAIDRVIDAALQTGCDAVHPGYGFLAENARFADRVIEAGLAWVGPSPDTIRLLGDKIAAKRTAAAAGVPTTPLIEISPGEVPGDVVLPALVKATAGGGGRGMRVVRSHDELAEALVSAAREAEAAFGDPALFIEPYIEAGRHVEVQIFGDDHGNVIHLGERECSIQRRNQKIIEEAPSAGISKDTRDALCAAAVTLAEHVGYSNAGTVEFMVDAHGAAGFLEVNTRLQVEHPVTEAITGLDLVELQLTIAEGEPLPVQQSDIVFAGHDIEARIVAESPSDGWLPSVGTLREFSVDGDVRVDAGVRAGSTVGPHYDSMIAKVIAHAPTRAAAARRLARALSTARVVGVESNTRAVAAILAERDFLAAETQTDYLERHPETLAGPSLDGLDAEALLLGAALASGVRNHQANPVTAFAPAGWRNVRTQGERRLVQHGEQIHQVEYLVEGGRGRAWIGPWPTPGPDGSLGPDARRSRELRVAHDRPDQVVIEIDGVLHRLGIDVADTDNGALTVSVSGRRRSEHFVIPARFQVPELALVGGGPVCPLPGTVIAVHVEAGQQVGEGDVLMIVEAMKMEHKITAAAAATVSDVHFGVGDRVGQGDLLVSLA